MAHSARLIVLCIVATLLMTNVYSQTPAPTAIDSLTNTSNTNCTYTTNTSNNCTCWNVTAQNFYSSNCTNITVTAAPTTMAPNTTTAAPNTTTAAPNTTTAAPNTTTAAPNTTTAAPNTTATPMNTTAPITNMTSAPAMTNSTTMMNTTTVAPTNATPVPTTTMTPMTTPAPTPAPTSAPPQISAVLNVTFSMFNQTKFVMLVAQVSNVSTSNVVVYTVSSTSTNVTVVFGFTNLLNPNSYTQSLLNGINNNSTLALTSVYQVLSIMVVATPAPTPMPTTPTPTMPSPTTPVPTTQPPSISMTLAGSIGSFNQTQFIAGIVKAANLTNSSFVNVLSVTSSSILVQFAFVGVPIAQIVATTNSFVAYAQNNIAALSNIIGYQVSNVTAVVHDRTG